MRPTFVKAVAALFAVSLVAAACGDDDDDSGTAATSATTAAAAATTAGSASATTSAATTAGGSGGVLQAPNHAELEAAVAKDPLKGPAGTGKTRGVTATSVKFGCVIQASAYDGAEDAFKARFEEENAKGGVNGRKIEMTACGDDAVSETTNLQLVRQQVLQDNVFGMLTVTAQTSVPSTDFMTENEVPYFGWALNPGFCGHRWGFGLNGCLIGGFLPDLVPHAVDQGNISLAIIKASGLAAKDVRFAAQSADDPTSAAGAALYQAAFENAGATVVYNEHNMPLQTSDYTPYVQALLATNPNIVFVAVAFENVGGLSAALKAAGYKGVIMNFVGYLPGLLGSSPQLAQALEGAYVNTQIVPQEAQTPYILQFEKDLVAVNAKNGKNISFGAALAYVEADLVVQLLKAAGPDLNTKTFDTAANGGAFVYKPLEGGPGAMPYPAQHFLPADCAAIVKIENAAYKVVVPFNCYQGFPAKK